MQADIITYNALMNSFQKSTRWAAALHWLQRAQDRFLEPSVVSYTTAITALRQSSQWQLTLEFLDKKWTLPTYNACITAVGAAWQQALCLLESLEGAQLEPDAGCTGYCFQIFQCVFQPQFCVHVSVMRCSNRSRKILSVESDGPSISLQDTISCIYHF